MKCSTLIKKLQKYPQNMHVMVEGEGLDSQYCTSHIKNIRIDRGCRPNNENVRKWNIKVIWIRGY